MSERERGRGRRVEPRDPVESREEQLQRLWEETNRAQNDAVPLELAEASDTQLGDTLARFIRGELSLAEMRTKEKEFRRHERGIVRLPDHEALATMLYNVGISAEEAWELAEHELHHYEEAVQLGFPDATYVLRFFIDEEGVSMRPGVEIQLPESGDEDAIRRHVRTIIEAPIELSDSDQRMLQE